MVEKEEVKMAKKIAPVVIKRVKIQEFSGESVADAVLSDRENRKAVDTILMRLKAV